MRIIICCLLFGFVIPVFSQENERLLDSTKIKIDSLYREDQFYLSFALNTLQNKPSGLSQNKFSAGFTLGFLRDFPINTKRTVAIAPGIGVAFNNYNQNLKITESNAIPVYSIIESNISYQKNRFSQVLIEVPLEFRWRSSTFESHKFWRIYAGIKMGYLVYDKSIFQDANTEIVIKNNADFNKFQYGTYLTVGYNSINVFAYYGFNPLFESAKSNTEAITMKSLNLGIMFYIL